MRRTFEQLSFHGLDPTPRDRLFFGVLPDWPVACRLYGIAKGLCGECALTGRPIRRSRLHVTLHWLGDYAELPNEIVAKAYNAASMVAATPFDVAFDRAGSFAGGRRSLPLVLQGDDASLAPLIAFQRALGDAMQRNGLGRRVSRRFTPHMTLLYDACAIEARRVAPVEWTVREFVLVHSLRGETKHIPIGRWPLHGVSQNIVN